MNRVERTQCPSFHGTLGSSGDVSQRGDGSSNRKQDQVRRVCSGRKDGGPQSYRNDLKDTRNKNVN